MRLNSVKSKELLMTIEIWQILMKMKMRNMKGPAVLSLGYDDLDSLVARR